ncbi:MAG: mannose-1-phosphate guanylyltransferase/mannose-6-phosphate isomerase [Hyphomicrobiales bacterium]
MSDEGAFILPVIMCGGSGTRLWPASRESMPKQFIPLLGEHSTFQAAVKRVSDTSIFLKPVVMANALSRFIVAEQLAAINVAADIILEPTRRDSAATVAAATAYAAKTHPGAVVLIMAADHVIKDAESFAEACRAAAGVARNGYIMTLGITPTYPATSYGYIALGAAIDGGGAHRVERFVEKPDAQTAAGYIAEGYLWNGGYFLFQHQLMLEELSTFAPDILAAAQAALAAATIDLDFIRLDGTEYEKAPRTSIDYAVIEKTERAGVLPVAFAWSDVGSWDAVWKVSPHDASGNVVRGRVELVETRDSLVHSDELLTTVVGLSDVIVVATPDAVLVSSRKSAEAVKDVVVRLRERRHPEADEHLRIYRPWGWYQRLDVGSRFQVKRIMVKPGSRLSLQKHFHRAEHWVVVRGVAETTVDDRVALLHETESVYVPIGATHRLANPGRIPLELIEVQVGTYTGEDDIVRLEDIYGRK